MNPLKRLRVAYGITQQDLADVCGVERGTILDAEQGMFRTVPPSILTALSRDDPEVAKALILDYHMWVRDSRQANANSFKCGPVETFTEFCFEVGGSVRGFCRALVMQRSIVTEYIRKGHRWADLQMALADVGLSEDSINYLERLPRE